MGKDAWKPKGKILVHERGWETLAIPLAGGVFSISIASADRKRFFTVTSPCCGDAIVQRNEKIVCMGCHEPTAIPLKNGLRPGYELRDAEWLRSWLEVLGVNPYESIFLTEELREWFEQNFGNAKAAAEILKELVALLGDQVA